MAGISRPGLKSTNNKKQAAAGATSKKTKKKQAAAAKKNNTALTPHELSCRQVKARHRIRQLKMDEGRRQSVMYEIDTLKRWDDQTGSTNMVREMNREIDEISVKYAEADSDSDGKDEIFDTASGTIARLFVIWAMNPDRNNGLSQTILNRSAKVKETKKVSGDWWTNVCADFKSFVEGGEGEYGWMDPFKSNKKTSISARAGSDDDDNDSDSAPIKPANRKRERPAATQPPKNHAKRMRPSALAGNQVVPNELSLTVDDDNDDSSDSDAPLIKSSAKHKRKQPTATPIKPKPPTTNLAEINRPNTAELIKQLAEANDMLRQKDQRIRELEQGMDEIAQTAMEQVGCMVDSLSKAKTITMAATIRKSQN